jgi:hypothetical protein
LTKWHCHLFLDNTWFLCLMFLQVSRLINKWRIEKMSRKIVLLCNLLFFLIFLFLYDHKCCNIQILCNDNVSMRDWSIKLKVSLWAICNIYNPILEYVVWIL